MSKNHLSLEESWKISLLAYVYEVLVAVLIALLGGCIGGFLYLLGKPVFSGKMGEIYLFTLIITISVPACILMLMFGRRVFSKAVTFSYKHFRIHLSTPFVPWKTYLTFISALIGCVFLIMCITIPLKLFMRTSGTTHLYEDVLQFIMLQGFRALTLQWVIRKKVDVFTVVRM